MDQHSADEDIRRFTFTEAPGLDGSVGLVSAPAMRVPLGPSSSTLMVPVLHVQDPAHLGNKLRNKLSKIGARGLLLGSSRASLSILEEAAKGHHQQLSLEVNLGLRLDDLNPRDRMNFKAFQRLTSDAVLKFLEIAADQERFGQRPVGLSSAFHTRTFLLVARYATWSFLDPTLEPLERIYQAWFARYFVEGWRKYLEERKLVSSEFISYNCFQCILLNSESLLLYTLWHLQLAGLLPTLRYFCLFTHSLIIPCSIWSGAPFCPLVAGQSTERALVSRPAASPNL